MDTRYALLAVFLCFVVGVGTVGVAGQSPADFSLESDATVATPTQTVSNQFTDGEITVDQTAVVEPNELLTGTASVPNPDEQTYFIQFRNSDRRVIDDKMTGGAETSFEFDASPESPGSYAVNIWDPDEQLVKSVLPVVIASHEVSSVQINDSSPSNADVAPSETPPVDVSLTTIESTDVEKVNLTVWDGDEVHSTTLENTASNEYEGTLPSLDAGTYQVQVRVRGGETVNGRPSLIGLSEAYSLTVSEPQESDDDDNTDGGSSSGGSGDGGGTDDSTGGGTNPDGSSDTDTSNNTDESTNTDASNTTDESNNTDDSNNTDGSTSIDDSNSTDGESLNGTDTDSTGETSDDTSDSTDTDGNGSEKAISPNNGTVSSDGTEDGTPLYAVQLTLLSLVLGSGFLRLQRTNED
jgi:hypothetical protein